MLHTTTVTTRIPNILEKAWAQLLCCSCILHMTTCTTRIPRTLAKGWSQLVRVMYSTYRRTKAYQSVLDMSWAYNPAVLAKTIQVYRYICTAAHRVTLRDASLHLLAQMGRIAQGDSLRCLSAIENGREPVPADAALPAAVAQAPLDLHA